MSQQMATEQNNSRLISQVIGALLILVGLGFVLLLVKLRTDGELSGDFGVSAFMIGFGLVLISIGSAFLIYRVKQPSRDSEDTLAGC